MLIVAEKPAVAKAMAAVLAPQARSTQTSAKYVRLFEFPYTIEGQNCTVFLTSVLGHLMCYDFPKEYRHW